LLGRKCSRTWNLAFDHVLRDGSSS
jgi:hypothetical protein